MSEWVHLSEGYSSHPLFLGRVKIGFLDTSDAISLAIKHRMKPFGWLRDESVIQSECHHHPSDCSMQSVGTIIAHRMHVRTPHIPPFASSATTPAPHAHSDQRQEPSSSMTTGTSMSSQRSMPRRRRRSVPKSNLSSSESFVFPHIVMLENITMDVSIDGNAFVIATQRAGGSTISSQRFSFDDLRQLKKRLLEVMQQGHYCQAECPWIYSFLKSYFPKKTALTLSRTQRMIKRRDAITMCFTKVLQFIANKNNHCCSIVTEVLSHEFARLLFGFETTEYSVQLLTPVGIRDTFASCSSTSSLSDSSGEEETQRCEVCTSSLHQSESDGDSELGVHRASNCSTTSTALSTGRRTSCAYYTMTLRCGHRFHDECILPILNETQRCPSCNRLEIE